jgi:dihydroflavonol-4-reductase
MSSTAFVTGATGLLGTNLVRELVREGWRVKALARSREKFDRLFHDVDVEPVIGEMEEIAGFASALEGCDTLFHCAAYFREYYAPGRHEDMLERINVQGTIELLDAAELAGVSKVIYASAAGVLGHSKTAGMVDESAAYALETTNLYFRSKIRAEQRIFDWMKSHRTSVVLILPGWMFGPFDEAPTTSGRLVQDFLAKNIPAIIPGGANVVDARDVAIAMIRSVEQGRPGERYIVVGPAVSLEEIAMTLQRITGIPAPRLRLPYSVALVVAWLSQTAASIRGAQSLLTVSGVRTMRDAMRRVQSSAKAERELGVSFRPLSETLQDEVAWFLDGRSEKPK